jgi:PAS domain S-box-containing protein
MNDEETNQIKKDELRKVAEKRIKESQRNFDNTPPEVTKQVAYELQVHQVELEMQNDELLRTQAELEESRARYFDLYNLAPVGYFTLNEKSIILEANLTFTNLLGVVRDALTKQPLTRFIFKEDQDIFYLHYKQLLETGTPQVCELRMLHSDSTQFWGRLEATTFMDDKNNQICRVVISDITKSKDAEEALQKANDEIKILRGCLPICASCKKIRDDNGLWNNVEDYLEDKTEAQFTHGICPECTKTLYPDYHKEKNREIRNE